MKQTSMVHMYSARWLDFFKQIGMVDVLSARWLSVLLLLDFFISKARHSTSKSVTIQAMVTDIDHTGCSRLGLPGSQLQGVAPGYLLSPLLAAARPAFGTSKTLDDKIKLTSLVSFSAKTFIILHIQSGQLNSLLWCTIQHKTHSSHS